MTTITIERAVVHRALSALEYHTQQTRPIHNTELAIEELRDALAAPATATSGRFKIGDHVFKVKGSQWSGRIVGWYSTDLTPIGWAVESFIERDSVQIYPDAALELIDEAAPATAPDSQEVKQIAEALRRIGMTLIRTGTGFKVMALGTITAQEDKP